MAAPTNNEAYKQSLKGSLPIGKWRYAAALTASDVTVYDPPISALLIGTAGTVTVKMAGDGATVAMKVIAGQLLPVSATQVMATGTVNAADFVGYWE